MLFNLSFLIRILSWEERILSLSLSLSLFLICFGYSAPSVFITQAARERKMKEYLFCVVAMWTSPASGSELGCRSTSLWDKMFRFHFASLAAAAVSS
jgi:hypothetical protein